MSWLRWLASDTYSADVTCINCCENDTVLIPRGKSVISFLDDKECKNCGVTGNLMQRTGRL